MIQHHISCDVYTQHLYAVAWSQLRYLHRCRAGQAASLEPSTTTAGKDEINDSIVTYCSIASEFVPDVRGFIDPEERKDGEFVSDNLIRQSISLNMINDRTHY